MGIQKKTLSICALVGGIIFIALGLIAKKNRQALEKDGVSTPGMITKAKVDSGSKGKKRYVIYVSWAEGAERQSDVPFVVKKDFFVTKVQGESNVTTPAVTIRHIPGKPDSSVVVGGTSDNGGMEWLGAVFLIFGGVGVYRGFFSEKSKTLTAV